MCFRKIILGIIIPNSKVLGLIQNIIWKTLFKLSIFIWYLKTWFELLLWLGLNS
jgi:hypothetical protein